MKDFFVPKDLLLFSNSMGMNSDFSVRGFGGGLSEAMATLTVTVSSGEVPVPTDPYWDNVVLCINPAGSSGDILLADDTGKMLSFMDGTQISTALGYPTIIFDGNLDGVLVPASSGFNFGSGDFTIEFQVRISAYTASSARLWNPNGDVYDGIDITVASSGHLSVAMSSNGTTFNVLNAGAFQQLQLNTDYYICIAREGGTVRCGVNGVVHTLSTGLGTTTLFYAGRPQAIGGQQGTNRSLNGHIRGYRVTKGVARDVGVIPALPYITGSTTLPASDPHWANVTLCINAQGANGSTAITDAKGKTVVVEGNTQVSTSRGYPAVLFDGNQDCLVINDVTGFAFGAGNFTLDFHIRKTGNVASTSRLWNCNGDVVNGLEVGIDSAGNLSCYLSSNGTSFNLLSAQTIAQLANNVDYFIRFARDGGTFRCGINGQQYVLHTTLGTTTLSNNGRPQSIGGQTISPYRNFHGMIRGVRVTTGVARSVAEVPLLPFLTA